MSSSPFHFCETYHDHCNASVYPNYPHHCLLYFEVISSLCIATHYLLKRCLQLITLETNEIFFVSPAPALLRMNWCPLTYLHFLAQPRASMQNACSSKGFCYPIYNEVSSTSCPWTLQCSLRCDASICWLLDSDFIKSVVLCIEINEK